MDQRLEELQRTLRALAQPLEVQASLFPAFVVLGDELVLEFGEALEACRCEGIAWSSEQERRLLELDTFIDSISGGQFLDLWTDHETMRSDPRWAKLRSLAVVALGSFGWENLAPDPSPAIFVPSRPY